MRGGRAAELPRWVPVGQAGQAREWAAAHGTHGQMSAARRSGKWSRRAEGCVGGIGVQSPAMSARQIPFAEWERRGNGVCLDILPSSGRMMSLGAVLAEER